eukprot:Hpha_TRINITY_DN15398_c0_g1::TRINITY_DN15398_c0_g1_i1::g.88565::m.88565/K08287/E2.7.12.1; dual-specificity kinase
MPYAAHPGMMPPSAPGYGGGGFSCGKETMIDGRYRVVDEAGRGNFARVLRAVDTQSNQMVAVKMLRSEYRRDAQFELDVLKAVTRNDPRGHARVCKMLRHFEWCNCPCFIMPLHGPSLKSRRFGVRNCGRQAVQRLAKQLGRALKYLHFDCRLVHTDLKPENILLDCREAPQGIGENWVICDLGSASFYTERPDQDLITTRPYRALEAVVGSPWSYAADMWSVACILYEVYVARQLFEASTDIQHLSVMQRRLGPVPSWVSDQAGAQQKRSCFDGAGRVRAGSAAGGDSLSQALGSDPELLDLILRLLDYDPALRFRADELVHHPFCAGASSQPDGPVLTHLPPSPYSSQRIRTPGTQLSAAGGQRPRADKLLNQQPEFENHSAHHDPHGHGHGHGRDGHGRAGSQPLAAPVRRGSGASCGDPRYGGDRYSALYAHTQGRLW